jgi:hypothetical protein
MPKQLTGVDGVEEVSSSSRVLDVGVDQQRIGFGVDVLPETEAVAKANRQVSHGGSMRVSRIETYIMIWKP